MCGSGQTGRGDTTMNMLSDLAGKVLLQSPVMPRNWRLFATSTFTVCPNPPPPSSSYFLRPARVFSVFLIRQTDKYWCAQALCYDIFIVCVHVEDVDVNTAFYQTLSAALAEQSSRFSRFIWQRWFVIVEHGELIHDECTFVQKAEWGFLSLAPFSSCLFGRYSFLCDLLPAAHPTLFLLFTFPSRNLFNQTSLFSLYDTASCSLLLCQSVSCAHSRSPSLCFHSVLT